MEGSQDCQEKRLTTQEAKIGEFMEEHFFPMVRTYRYHIFLVYLLGKTGFAEDRLERALETPGNVARQADYTEALQAVCNKEIQSSHFGESIKVSMEGACSHYIDPEDGERKLRYDSCIADDKRQDSRTSFINAYLCLDLLMKEGKLKEGGTLYGLFDGCTCQYRDADAFYFMSALAIMF